MLSFKLWMQQENLSPGGGATMDDPAADMRSRAASDARLGVGAFHQGGDRPPLRGTGFPKAYLDPKHRKSMKKYMSKGSGESKKVSSCKMTGT